MNAQDSRFQARPTTYKGINMRSRLEATWAARLDSLGLDWEYEPRCFANELGQYLPDFTLVTGGYRVYFEVKGVIGDPLGLMRQMEIVLDSEPDAWLTVAVGAPLISVPAYQPDKPGVDHFWRLASAWYRGVQWVPDWSGGRPVREWEVCTDGDDPSLSTHLLHRFEGSW